MDTDTAGVAAVTGRDKRSDKPGTSSDNNRNKAPLASRQSPITPLAPLEYLQTQRKGSITDPSLHASPKSQSKSSHLSSSHNLQQRSLPTGTRLAAPHVLGDASVQSTDPKQTLVGNGVVRKGPVQDGSRRSSGKTKKIKESDNMMDVDSVEGQQPTSSKPPTPGPQGTKRKVASDNATSMTQHIDPQLVGPGISNAMTASSSEGPAPKRRGSAAIDAQKISQLSLYDRRNSTDMRAGPSAPAMSTMPLAPNSAPAYAAGAAFPGNMPHGRPSGVATFTWPTQPPDPASSSQAMHSDPNHHIQGPPRSFDPSIQPMQMMPTVNFGPDRRMSAPENAAIASSTGPTRALRSRSRPPSRGLNQIRGVDQTISDHTSPQVMSHDDASSSGGKDDGVGGGSRQTPYSRSPELRVSHKLAERKRRKEMKDLFDELRDQLPQDRGMKASKWEILSKAIDFIVGMKQTHAEMSRDIEMLRHEVEGFRQGMPPFHPGGPPPQVMFSQHVVPPPYPHQPGQPVPPHHGGPHPGPPPPGQQQQPQQQQQPPPGNQPSRPGSSQNSFPPGNGPNGNAESRTGTPSS